MEKLLKLRDEMKEDLLHGSIFPFWEQYTIDHENGGFYGAVTVDKVIHKDASKGLVLNARLLWTFAGAYRIFGDEKYKELADRAFNYIVERFWDHKNGGGFWMRPIASCARDISSTSAQRAARKHADMPL